MDLYEAIEIICKDYCKYPDVESGNKLADICDKCPMNKCEDLRWADRKTENSLEIPNNCDTCRHYTLACDLFSEICKYEPKDELQTDKDFKVTYTCSFTDCDNFKNFGFGEKCIECKRKQSKAKYRDEPQTIVKEMSGTHNERMPYIVAEFESKDEPQNEVRRCMTCKYNPWVSKACREYKGGVCDNYEPQTKCETCRYTGECDWESWQDCPYTPKDKP